MHHSSSAMLTDLYQLTMLQGYFHHGMEETAVFEFFSRKLPEERNFLIAAGLEQALDFLENLSFMDEEIGWLDQTGFFQKDFLDYLRALQFTGDVHAMPEGTVFFADEPILRVVATLPQAQLVETRLINILHFQSLVASKAARLKLIAPNKLLVDFGLRRAHGAEAGMFAARASYIAGFNGTSNVLAGREYGMPIFGTMAHSFIQAHDSESESFMRFAQAQPENVVLLIDTYDTEAAAEKIVRLMPEFTKQGIVVKGVRLDSGDLVDHANKVRRILDNGGLHQVTIFSSGSLDEYRLKHMIDMEAPIDGFGVGTRLDTSADAPYLDCAYKLEEYGGIARRKRSEGKVTWPGRKQVFRQFNDDESMSFDLLTLEGDEAEGKPLLQPVMQGGKRLSPATSLAQIQEYTLSQLKRLPSHLKRLVKGAMYPVQISSPLRSLALEVDERNSPN